MKPVANCPQCGAKVDFRWDGAVQAVCEFCRSVLVRSDYDLKKLGTVAQWALEDSSPIQINTEGVWEKKAFVVVGRIIYEWEQGGWNEWFLLFSDGSSGWLSDAQLEWAVTMQVEKPGKTPRSPDSLTLGQECEIGGTSFTVTTMTQAHYKGVEGQLPFVYWDKQDVMFADLRTSGRDLATIDYSENPPLVFVGRFADFEELQLKNLRQFEGWV